MARTPAADSVRCIATVKRRVRAGCRVVPEHRCAYRAHALAETRVQVCRVHARVRPRRKQRAPGLEQLSIEFEGASEVQA
jgi:hypothetical protein